LSPDVELITTEDTDLEWIEVLPGVHVVAKVPDDPTDRDALRAEMRAVAAQLLDPEGD